MELVLDVETLAEGGGLPFERASTAHKSIARRLNKALGELSGSSSTDFGEDDGEECDVEVEEDLSVEEWSTTEDDDETDANNGYVAIGDELSFDTEETQEEERHSQTTSRTTTPEAGPPVRQETNWASSACSEWSVTDVVHWLKRNELNDFVEKFEYHRFAGKQLLLLDWSSVKLLGEHSSDRREKLLVGVALLARKEPTSVLRRTRKTMSVASPRHAHRVTRARKIRRGLTVKGTTLRKSASAAANTAISSRAATMVPTAVKPESKARRDICGSGTAQLGAKGIVAGAVMASLAPVLFSAPLQAASTLAPIGTHVQPAAQITQKAAERRRRSLPTPPSSPAAAKSGALSDRFSHEVSAGSQHTESLAEAKVPPDSIAVLRKANPAMHTYVNLQQALGIDKAGEQVHAPALRASTTIAAPEVAQASSVSPALHSSVGLPKTDPTTHTYVNLQALGINAAGKPVSASAGPEPAAQASMLSTAGLSSSDGTSTENEVLSQNQDSATYGIIIPPDDAASSHGEPLYDTRTLPESKVEAQQQRREEPEKPNRGNAANTPILHAPIKGQPEASAKAQPNRHARPRPRAATTIGFDYADPKTLNLKKPTRPRAATGELGDANTKRAERDSAQQNDASRVQRSTAGHMQPKERQPQQHQHQKERRGEPHRQQQQSGRDAVQQQSQRHASATVKGGDRRKKPMRQTAVPVAPPPVPDRPSQTEPATGEVDLSVFSWYRGFMSRQDAEQLLASSLEGTFLMRSSSRAPEPVVSFVHRGTIQHCRVKRNEKLKFSLGDIEVPFFLYTRGP